MSDEAQNSRLPANWNKQVMAAFLIMIGHTWESAARSVGRSRSALYLWMQDEDQWQRAKEAAVEQWYSEVKDASRRAVYKQVDGGDGDLGLKILERLDDRMKPKQSTEHSGRIEGDLSGKTREELEALADEYRKRREARQRDTL